MAVLFKLVLVRHGETTANRDGVLQGQTDYPLSDTGLAQAQIVADHLAQSYTFDCVWSSDLSRASDTAAAIMSRQRAPPPPPPQQQQQQQQSAAPQQQSTPSLPPSQADSQQQLQPSSSPPPQPSPPPPQQQPPRVTLDPLLREVNLGVLETLPRGTGRQRALAIKAERAGVPLAQYAPPPSETMGDLTRRAASFCALLIDAARAQRSAGAAAAPATAPPSPSAHEDGAPDAAAAATAAAATAVASAAAAAAAPVYLAVSHGGFMHALLTSIMGVEGVRSLGNCCVCEVDVLEEQRPGATAEGNSGGGELCGGGGGGKRGGGGAVLYAPRRINDTRHLDAAGLQSSMVVENLL
ncbi:histidine phosphatase superfamily [Tribonema minus]|uniref:Histidine phosphatase superfamily n=1 Tax=Tribonema minus TaxID=303371 RepID=A0A835ZEE6_9STRA|nr:histidine phosphatase superfamily [Tribonema minus]